MFGDWEYDPGCAYDCHVPLEEQLEALARAVEAGKVPKPTYLPAYLPCALSLVYLIRPVIKSVITWVVPCHPPIHPRPAWRLLAVW